MTGTITGVFKKLLRAPITVIAQVLSPFSKILSKFGIKGRLFLAFGFVALLTLASGGLGITSFVNLGNSMNNINESTLTSFGIAQKLSKATAGFVASGTQISAATTYDVLEEEQTTAKEKLANLVALIGEAETAGGNKEALRRALETTTQMGEVLENLSNKATERNGSAYQVTNELLEIGLINDEIQYLIGPAVKEQVANLNKDAKALLAEDDVAGLKAGFKKIVKKDFRLVQRLLQLKSDINAITSILFRTSNQDSTSDIEVLQDEFTEISTRLNHVSMLSDFEQKEELQGLAKALFELATKKKNIFVVRTNYLESVEAISAAIEDASWMASELELMVDNLVIGAEHNSKVVIADANSNIKQSTNLQLIIVGSSLLISLLIAWLYVGRNLMNRLNAFVEDMRDVAGGNLETEIHVNGTDEIRELSDALIGFRDGAIDAETARNTAENERSQRESDKQLADQQANEAERKAHEDKEQQALEAEQAKRSEMNLLADNFEGSVKHLIENFAAATTQMTASSQSMTETANTTSDRSKTVASASDHASNSVNSVASATEELSSSINEISRQVGTAASIATEAVSEAERTNIMVNSLQEAASKIGDVVSLINDIAGQTNLLALNATIEAARAGDAGKGFAVVASEVKNLATQTGRATEEISSQIKAVQDETSNAVTAIGGISTTIGRISEIATSIASAVEEQGAATGEISRNVQQAAQSTQEVSQNISSVNSAAMTTGQSASEVKNVADGLSKDVGNLDTEVKRFLQSIRS